MFYLYIACVILEMVAAVLCQQGAGHSWFCYDCDGSDASRKSFRRCGCVAAGNDSDPRRVASTAARSRRLGQAFVDPRRSQTSTGLISGQSPIEVNCTV